MVYQNCGDEASVLIQRCKKLRPV
jgi:hypothetical protein